MKVDVNLVGITNYSYLHLKKYMWKQIKIQVIYSVKNAFATYSYFSVVVQLGQCNHCPADPLFQASPLCQTFGPPGCPSWTFQPISVGYMMTKKSPLVSSRFSFPSFLPICRIYRCVHNIYKLKYLNDFYGFLWIPVTIKRNLHNITVQNSL